MKKVPNYLIRNIVVTLLCVPPFWLIAITIVDLITLSFDPSDLVFWAMRVAMFCAMFCFPCVGIIVAIY